MPRPLSQVWFPIEEGGLIFFPLCDFSPAICPYKDWLGPEDGVYLALEGASGLMQPECKASSLWQDLGSVRKKSGPPPPLPPPGRKCKALLRFLSWPPERGDLGPLGQKSLPVRSLCHPRAAKSLGRPAASPSSSSYQPQTLLCLPRARLAEAQVCFPQRSPGTGGGIARSLWRPSVAPVCPRG